MASSDELYMERALRLAAETTALASPNPYVGCVIVRDGQVLGEGAHLYDNYDHAEIVALKQAASRGHSVEGATAYVTLEPCSHHGRTGPCADALITARVARVAVATADPNPLVSGRGIEKLRAAGIEVSVGTLQQQARDFNDAFAHFIRTRVPFVTLKAALSADGKLAPPPSSRLPNQPHWLTGPAARDEVQRLRHTSDAILTGIGTVLADDPLLTDRTQAPRRRPLLRVILDTHLRIPPNSQLVRSANRDLLVITSASVDADKIEALRQKGVEVEIIADSGAHPSLPAVLALLAERKILNLLLEVGPHLNGAFLLQDLVDKVILFHTGVTLGEDAVPFAEGIPSLAEFEHSLHRVTRTAFDLDISVTGYLHDPWSEK
jgi:diaminohydroxyphosphoribosylaminopyrimidine deaminase/5-amino-6-(5-phosphoribosylamino)uracil reductase